MAITAIVLALSVLGGMVWWTVQRNRRPGAPQYKPATTSTPVSHAPFASTPRGAPTPRNG